MLSDVLVLNQVEKYGYPDEVYKYYRVFLNCVLTCKLLFFSILLDMLCYTPSLTGDKGNTSDM